MTQAAKHTIEELPTLRLPELQAYYAEVIGEPTRCPNKKFLVRRITETLAEQAEGQTAVSEETTQPESALTTDVVEPDGAGRPAEPAEAPPEDSTEGDPDEQDATVDKPLTKLTVEELRQRYQDVVGRSTGSSHRRYLIWKIRQAQKGKVPVGPRRRRSPDEPAPDFKVLPLRMEADLVTQLDQARERLGLKNRMELFRAALHMYLASRGEVDVAGRFAG